MKSASSHSDRYRRVLFFILFFMAAAASFNGFYAKWHFREAGTTQFIPRLSFEAMIDGTADRPFVYRRLVPAFANWVDSRVPQDKKDAIVYAKSSSGVPVLNYLFDSPITSDPKHLFRYTVVYFTVAFSSWVAVCAMYLMARTVGYSPVPSALAVVTLVLFLPYFFTVGGYFYDYPEIAFISLAVFTAVKFDWWWTIPVVVLGTWNKESFLFFIPALFPFLRLRASRNKSWIGLIVLGLCSIAVSEVIRLKYQHNPGTTVEVHLLLQLAYFVNPINWFSLDVTYGELVFRGLNPFSFALTAGAFWLGWRRLSRPLQQHLLIAAAINVPLYLLFGFPGEIRALSLLCPAFLFAMAANVTGWCDSSSAEIGSLHTRDQNSMPPTSER